MLRRLSATPCPIGDPPTNLSRRNSNASISNDTISDLEYTTEFKALFRNTKPRRRPTTAVKGSVPVLEFAIHEDEELNLAASTQNAARSQTKSYSRQSVVPQPAQRPSHRPSPVVPEQDEVSSLPPVKMYSGFAKAPKRLSLQPQASSMPSKIPEDHTLSHVPSPKISKPARRGTIYIPSEDTTMPSLYMGIFSPLKEGVLSAGREENSDITGLAAQMAKKKPSRKSVLCMSPKRAPLVQQTKALQAPTTLQLQVGRGSGKENIPPGYELASQNQTSKKLRKSVVPAHMEPHIESAVQRPSSRLFEPTASSSARSRLDNKTLKSSKRPAWNSGLSLIQTQPVISMPDSRPRLMVNAERAVQDINQPHRVPTRFIVPSVPAKPILDNFPLLTEGGNDASMYEESWLTQQEVAITQLVNNLFKAASPYSASDHDNSLLRLKLRELYGSPEISLLYKRLRGTLMYGALGVSRDAIECGRRLIHDVGYRKAFVDLWLDSYEHQTFRTVFEVVIGRLVRRDCGHRSEDDHETSALVEQRRFLQKAIETFLIRNEDGDPDPEMPDPASWSLQRTILRSLILVKLLDTVKKNQGLPAATNLFQTSSIHKSSTSVLQHLVRMLNPSVGDATRPLNHIGYAVSHCQFPLEEYHYEIRNLAVDLRDGVRVVRLVELLLYRSASLSLGHNIESDTTLTFAVPSCETLSIASQQDWPLSQHLKFPCLSRGAKMFNVEIALTALRSVKGVKVLFEGISASDIVDGYREKTVRLLWVLTSKWGLSGLVDWNDLKGEIKRLGRSGSILGDLSKTDFEYDEDEPEYLQYKALLKAWVKAVASAHGLAVRNFTTSFADGRVFEAVVCEYQPYLAEVEETTSNLSFSSRLKRLGCSEQFVRLFEQTPGPGKERVFDRDFVMASLAFLCSRLLGPSKRARAAVVIQRRWREHWVMVLTKRKAALGSLASSCAAKVQSEQLRIEATA